MNIKRLCTKTCSVLNLKDERYEQRAIKHKNHEPIGANGTKITNWNMKYEKLITFKSHVMMDEGFRADSKVDETWNFFSICIVSPENWCLLLVLKYRLNVCDVRASLIHLLLVSLRHWIHGKYGVIRTWPTFEQQNVHGNLIWNTCRCSDENCAYRCVYLFAISLEYEIRERPSVCACACLDSIKFNERLKRTAITGKWDYKDDLEQSIEW